MHALDTISILSSASDSPCFFVRGVRELALANHIFRVKTNSEAGRGGSRRSQTRRGGGGVAAAAWLGGVGC